MKKFSHVDQFNTTRDYIKNDASCDSSEKFDALAFFAGKMAEHCDEYRIELDEMRKSDEENRRSVSLLIETVKILEKAMANLCESHNAIAGLLGGQCRCDAHVEAGRALDKADFCLAEVDAETQEIMKEHGLTLKKMRDYGMSLRDKRK